MKANRARWPIATMARLLGVSTSGYYAWRVHEPSRQSCSDAQLLAHIRTLHASSRGTYGAPRIHAQLAREGVHVGRKRVARLMRLAGLCGASRRRWPRTTRPRAGARRAPDLVRRHFSAEGPNILWVADATYIPTGEVGSPMPLRTQGPRGTVRASFPAYGSSTALSAVLTSALSEQHRAFANVESSIYLIA
jgi:putative transposase